MFPFAQSLRQAQILLLEILLCIPVVNPAMAGSPSLTLNPAVSGKRFETTSWLLFSYKVTITDAVKNCQEKLVIAIKQQ